MQNARYLGYIDRYKGIAIETFQTHGVPASITLAQGLLESNAGGSYLATRGNNHFGIKCHKWAGEVVEYDDTLKHDCYRKYGAPEDSFLDHAKFLCAKRYRPLHELDSTDYRGWAEGLRKCGYAEDPAYPQKLIAIIDQYGLSQYDSIALTIPAAPVLAADKPQEKSQAVAEKPKKKSQAKTEKPKSEPEKSVATEQRKPSTRRPRNQRSTSTARPLTGSPDNEEQ